MQGELWGKGWCQILPEAQNFIPSGGSWDGCAGFLWVVSPNTIPPLWAHAHPWLCHPLSTWHGRHCQNCQQLFLKPDQKGVVESEGVCESSRVFAPTLSPSKPLTQKEPLPINLHLFTCSLCIGSLIVHHDSNTSPTAVLLSPAPPRFAHRLNPPECRPLSLFTFSPKSLTNKTA